MEGKRNGNKNRKRSDPIFCFLVVLNCYRTALYKGRTKWDEALVDIASVPGRRLGRSRSGRLA